MRPASPLEPSGHQSPPQRENERRRSSFRNGFGTLASSQCGALAPGLRGEHSGFFAEVRSTSTCGEHVIGTEPLAKGPLVVLLDESGPMDGDKDIWSTAVALALLEIA